MTEKERAGRLAAIEAELAGLPRGTLVYKTIRGKDQPYLQWSENGRTRSLYIRKNTREDIFAALEKRKALWAERDALKGIPVREPEVFFRCYLLRGESLNRACQGASGDEKTAGVLAAMLKDPDERPVVLTVPPLAGADQVLLKTASLLPAEETALIRLTGDDRISLLTEDLSGLAASGIRFVLIDGVTDLPDFQSQGALLAASLRDRGLKALLTGDRPLSLFTAAKGPLFGRVRLFSMTFAPDSAPVVHSPEEIGTYFQAALGRDLGRDPVSLETAFPGLAGHPEGDWLLSAARRVIDDIDRSALLPAFQDVLRTYSYDSLTGADALRALNTFLDESDRANQKQGVTAVHVTELRRLFTAAGLTETAALENTVPDLPPYSLTLTLVPGLRETHGEELISWLFDHTVLMNLPKMEKLLLADALRLGIRELCLKDSVFLQAKKENPGAEVFLLQTETAFYDLVVFHPDTNSCELAVISDFLSPSEEDIRALSDTASLASVKALYGKVTARTCYYRGKDKVLFSGIILKTISLPR